ncbi:uncharacterized protein LOC131222361 isoform X1 [Magnolia sinica]|uniref:uncharacterized protein LOC131222361 isoform X1 n=1 Tax=Magnolia sinica TaxID=86752 RepID=UPI0026591D99|nr:uncharacterized protein LOC131222361 isoform X1 [Magnolia sinica]
MVAVYAEFRRDWVEALRSYEDAYHVLREMIGTSKRLPPIQRLVEIKAVAEQLHFKVSTLLLHGGKVVEAITWFQKHIASYKRLVGAPEVVFLHWEWMSRQFLVFAELLETSSVPIPTTASLPSVPSERSLTEWEFQPSYYYQSAAKYLREKRDCLELALSASEKTKHPLGANSLESSPESVIPSVYVGQFARLLEQEDGFAMLPLTDGEYVLHALAEGKRFQDSYEIIALLRKSFESYNSLKVQRMASYCSNLMAREYFNMGDFSNAKQLFDGIMGLYRQEGWVTLIWGILGYLRECSRKLASPRDFVEYSLEMAALPILSGVRVASSDQKGVYGPAGPPSLPQRVNIQKEAFGLLKGESTPLSSEGSSSLTITEDQPLHLEIDPVSPLRAAFLASVAFHDQAVKLGAPTLFTVSLLTQLSHPVEIDQLEIQFNQSVCNFIVINGQKALSEENPIQEQGLRIQTVPNLTLVWNKWLRLTYNIKSGQTGKLECLSIIVKIGRHSTICCRAESPASMEELPLWKFEDRVETFPTKDPGLAFTGQKVIQVEEPDPQVDLVLSASGPALVGENFAVPVTITSKGHKVLSGELKINLVDTRGGGLLSPREYESFSFDSLHVELLSISGSTDEDESQTDVDDIKQVQQSFGLVSIPALDIGESWSGKLEIRWHRPKPIMLYVSLGYSPNSKDKDANAPKVHVHRSLQIEGKAPVAIGHRFMMPFRRDPLLLSNIKPALDSDLLPSLALNEKSILIASARNCTEVPLRLISMSVEVDDNESIRRCTVQHVGDSSTDLALLMPGEEYKRVFSVTPQVNSPKLSIGTVFLRWVRDLELKQQPHSDETTIGILTKHQLPDIKVEKAPLVVILECPPTAILGVPFSFYLRIRNQTQLLQEIKFSLVDSPSFVLAGPHNDATFILPDSEHILSYKLIPLASGQQQLPRIAVTSIRYSAGLNPSPAACTVFVFPCQPHFEKNGEVVKVPGSVPAV